MTGALKHLTTFLFNIMSCWSCFHRLGVYVRDIQSKACFPNAQPTVVGFKQSERQNLFKSQILKKASICLVICKTNRHLLKLGDIPPMYMIGARIKVRETVSAALVDGNAGFGAVVGQFSMELAMQKASMCNYNRKQGRGKLNLSSSIFCCTQFHLIVGL